MRWWAILVVVTLSAGIAGANPEVERAIKIGGEGIALYEQQNYADAYERFAIADRMAHSVVFVLYMARCKRNLGQLLAARALLEQVAREELPPDATEPMRRARDEATGEIAALASRVPSLIVNVSRAARVRVDGAIVTAGVPVELDPGEHVVEATSEGAPPVTRKVQLVEGGGQTTIELAFVDESPRAGSRTPAWIAFGLGATGLAAGTVTGVIALRAANRLEERCIESHCFDADRPEADRASRYATVSTVSFAIAGVSIAAGVALWYWRPGKRAAIAAGPTEVAIVGQF